MFDWKFLLPGSVRSLLLLCMSGNLNLITMIHLPAALETKAPNLTLSHGAGKLRWRNANIFLVVEKQSGILSLMLMNYVLDDQRRPSIDVGISFQPS